jgi:hypothetical protein
MPDKKKGRQPLREAARSEEETMLRDSNYWDCKQQI